MDINRPFVCIQRRGQICLHQLLQKGKCVFASLFIDWYHIDWYHTHFLPGSRGLLTWQIKYSSSLKDTDWHTIQPVTTVTAVSPTGAQLLVFGWFPADNVCSMSLPISLSPHFLSDFNCLLSNKATKSPENIGKEVGWVKTNWKKSWERSFQLNREAWLGGGVM